MAQFANIMSPVQGESGSFIFWCEGCGCAHGIDARWDFDGDLASPTISPSVLSIGEKRCHSFVRSGSIQYLADSEHGLAGKTVPMKPLPWND